MVARSFFSTVPHMRHYQTLGDVWIDLPALAGTQRVEKNEFGIPCVLDEPLAVEGYERHLALSEAVVESSFTARGTRYIRECFASHPAGAIVYRVASSDGTAFDA